jgi:putative addiction module killer protein
MYEVIQTETYARWERALRDDIARAAIAARVTRLAAGLAGDVRPVGGGVTEARIHYGPGYRVYFLMQGRKMIILLCGGDKSSQERDIAKAKALASTLEF